MGWIFGNGSYEFLQFPMDARNLSLYNSASAYNGSFLSNNPASLSTRTKSKTYSYFYLPANIHYTGYQKIQKSQFGIKSHQVSFMSYGAIKDSETEENSYAYDLLIKSGYKREIKDLTSIGISGGYLLSSIAGYKSQLIFSNIGIRSRILRKKLGVGFSIENIGFIIKSYTEVKEKVPTLYRTAIYYEPRYIPLVINGDFVKYLDEEDLFYIFGAIEFKPNSCLTLRLGASSNRNGFLTGDFTSDVIAGLSGGAGFLFNNMILDIGLMNLGPAGFVMGFSVNKNM
tara:strand:+ start:975 stop:1829 length:855 start_codon:yes stop_codon:yes gene_type:complete